MCVTFRGPPCKPVRLNDQVDRRSELLPHRLQRQFDAAHRDHRLQSGNGVTGAVGVNRRQRTFVAGVHRLQHVERFRTTAFADDDAVGSHTEAVFHQVGRADPTLAFDVRRPRFEPQHVVLLQLKFGRVFDRHDSLVVLNEARQRVEQRRFTGTGTAADDHVQAGLDRPFQQHHHFRRERFVIQQIFQLQRVRTEATNRQRRSVKASGGMIALTREPSGRRASHIGEVSSMRRPTFETMRSRICIRWSLSRKTTFDF